MLDKFWEWYKRNYRFNLALSTFLFALQIFHLYWLFTDVILLRLIGESYFFFPPYWGLLSTVLDYTEIPAIFSTTILYWHLLREKFAWKTLGYLFLINVQWLHILWITDEVVLQRFAQDLSLFHWANVVAWIAILIDYLELPVIYDTSRRLYRELKYGKREI